MHSFDLIQRHGPISELTPLANTTVRIGEHVMKALNKAKQKTRANGADCIGLCSIPAGYGTQTVVQI